MFRTKRVVLGVAAAALVLATFAGPASADTVANSTNNATNLVVTNGSLGFQDTVGVPVFSDFVGVTLNGSPQLSSAKLSPFIVEDSRGSGAGWHVSLTVPFLTDGSGHVLGHELDTASATGMLDTEAAVVQADAGTPSAAAGPTNLVPAPNALTDFDGQGAQANYVVAQDAAGNGGTYPQGMGSFLVSPRPFVLTVPANAYAGTYTATAVISVTTGP